MLKSLTIKNFGLIEEVNLDFDRQLNILTGETGAGKSILIDALRMALGAKFQTSQLRDSVKSGFIEAVFNVPPSLLKSELCADFLEDGQKELIIQRLCSPEGTTKIKINGFSVTLSQLKSLGALLIDFHGAHDHQLLLDSQTHLSILDRLVDFGSLQEDYQKIYSEYQDVKRKISELAQMSQSRERELDLLAHQVKELERFPLKKDSYEELEKECSRINNAERLSEKVTSALQALDQGEIAILELLSQAYSSIKQLSDIDPSTAEHLETILQLQDQSETLIQDLKNYAGNLNFERDYAQEIYVKKDHYDDILRKYGPMIDEAQNFYLQAKAKYDLLLNFDEKSNDLDEALKKIESRLSEAADKISKLRIKQSKQLKKVIEKELSELGIANVLFEVVFNKEPFSSFGFDKIEFYISPNLGMEPKPLADIISSGEAARVMLGLKKALINVDPVSVLIFDEIDAQIGGRLGTVTGQKLREISRYRQVILITHLPQIASFADRHFKVVKSVRKSLTFTDVILLDSKTRVEELASMLGGQNKKDISLKHAQEMLADAAK